ncbi:response regulator, partial [bacterium]|nr:response regulator [candidate division CSSED10-310 bacterium]
ILVVDDEPEIRQILKRLLSKDGFYVDTVEDGTEAINFLNKGGYQIVITDVIFSQGDGLELLERIRLLFPDIIAIIISATNDIDTAVKAMQYGASGFVMKPFRLDEIRLTIQTALKNRQQHEKRGRMQILTDLVDAGKEVSASLDRDILAHKIVEYAHRITLADTASLLLVDHDADELYIAASIGLKDKYKKGYRMPKNEGIAGWALHRCFCLNLRQSEVITPEIGKMMRRNNVIKSSICMPIFSDGLPLGVVNVSRLQAEGKQDFDQSDVNFLSILSSHAAVCIRNSDLFDQFQNLYAGSIQALSSALEAKDTYTGGHSERVANFTMMIADKLGMSMTEKRELWTAAILHDLGKIGTPEDILNKASALNSAEWSVIQTHPTTGAQIVGSIPALKQIAPIILHHHEWYDGSGYPMGIAGEQIPIGARILSLADALEAMTSNRPYRKMCPRRKIMQELIEGKGRQFDPLITDLLIQMIEKKDIRLTN